MAADRPDAPMDLPADPVPHMSPDDFRRHGRAVVDWIADYLEHADQHPVLSRVRPGDVRAQLPADPPQHGESFEQMLADVDRIILPGLTHWQSPNFFAFFPANNSYPSILGELLSAGLGVQGMLWATSPACTELETHVLDWLVDMLELPRAFHSCTDGGGVIQDTASSSTLAALLAARERATAHASNQSGLAQRPTLTAYASEQAHSSIEKAMMIAGLGRENLRLVETDGRFAMKPDHLDRAIADDRAAGRLPCCIFATVGTTSSGANDPLRAIGRIARAHDIWLHVDAAMAGSAALCPEFRHLHDGLDLADSYCFNPHKWLLTNFDCDCFYVADRAALVKTLSILPEYLKNRETLAGAVFDYRDWHVQLGRRFRALKLWFVIRHYGVAGLQAFIRRHVALAQTFADWVRADPRFELLLDPPPLNLVCFRLDGTDELNQALLDRLNDSGRLYLTHTKLDGRFVLRMSIGQRSTDLPHVRAAWELIRHDATLLLASAQA